MANLTIDELLADEALLRREAGRVLHPGPWKHQPEDATGGDGPLQVCAKECGAERQMDWGVNKWGTWYDENGAWWPECPIPDPAEGPLEVVAESLLRHLRTQSYWYIHLTNAIRRKKQGRESAFEDFLVWLLDDPAERIACCLLALEGDRE